MTTRTGKTNALNRGHGPVEVLDWHKGTLYPASVLAQALHPPAFPRMDCCAFRTENSTPSGVCPKRTGDRVGGWMRACGSGRVPGRDPGHLHGRASKTITGICARSAPLVWSRRRSARPSSRVFPLGPDEWVLSGRTPDLTAVRRTRKADESSQHVLFEPFGGGTGGGSGRRREAPSLVAGCAEGLSW